MDAIENRLEVPTKSHTPALRECHRRTLTSGEMTLDHLRGRFPIRTLLGGEGVQILAQSSTIIGGAELPAHIPQLRHIWLAWTGRSLARWILDLVDSQLDDVI